LPSHDKESKGGGDTYGQATKGIAREKVSMSHMKKGTGVL